MAFFRKNLPKSLREKALELVDSLERSVCVLKSIKPPDSRYTEVARWAAELAPVAAEIAAVVRERGSRTQAANLMMDINPIMLAIAGSSRGDWEEFNDASEEYGKFHFIFRDPDHLNEEL